MDEPVIHAVATGRLKRLCAAIAYPDEPVTLCQYAHISVDLVAKSDVSELNRWHRKVFSDRSRPDYLHEDEATCMGSIKQTFIVRSGGLEVFRVDIGLAFTETDFLLPGIEETDHVFHMLFNPFRPRDITVLQPAMAVFVGFCFQFDEVRRLVTRLRSKGPEGLKMLSFTGFRSLETGEPKSVAFLDNPTHLVRGRKQ